MTVPSSPFSGTTLSAEPGQRLPGENKYASRPPSQVTTRFPDSKHQLSTLETHRLPLDLNLILGNLSTPSHLSSRFTTSFISSSSSPPPPPPPLPPQCLPDPNTLPARVLHQVGHYQPCPSKVLDKVLSSLVTETAMPSNFLLPGSCRTWAMSMSARLKPESCSTSHLTTHPSPRTTLLTCEEH